MNADYDARRPGEFDDVDPPPVAPDESADDRDDEMSVPVVPMRADELRCGRCFLVQHRSRIAVHDGVAVCRDCS